ncbi:MAG: hypothetical protein ACLRZL_11120 [Alistipes communis]
MNKVSFRLTFAEALEIGVKNAPSIIGCVVLWLLTIWVPYINVGTTIAINMLPIELAKGGVISPLGIFDAKYRKYMGDFLITTGLMIIPVFIASLFMIVPGIVLSIAWSLAYFFLFEKKKNPMQAISASNEATYGSKWTMFFVLLAFVVAAYVIAGIFCLDLRGDRRGIHYLRRPAGARCRHHVDLAGDQRFVLATTQRQRTITDRRFSIMPETDRSPFRAFSGSFFITPCLKISTVFSESTCGWQR